MTLPRGTGFEPWWSGAELTTFRSQKLPAILTLLQVSVNETFVKYLGRISVKIKTTEISDNTKVSSIPFFYTSKCHGERAFFCTQFVYKLHAKIMKCRSTEH